MGRSIDDYRRAFWGSSAEELDALRDAGEAGVTASSLFALAGQIHTGEDTPEAALAAPVGSLFLRSNGGANTTLYVKESGTGNTGWVAK